MIRIQKQTFNKILDLIDNEIASRLFTDNKLLTDLLLGLRVLNRHVLYLSFDETVALMFCIDDLDDLREIGTEIGNDELTKYIDNVIEIETKKKSCDGCFYGWAGQQDHKCLYNDC